MALRTQITSLPVTDFADEIQKQDAAAGMRHATDAAAVLARRDDVTQLLRGFVAQMSAIGNPGLHAIDIVEVTPGEVRHARSGLFGRERVVGIPPRRSKVGTLAGWDIHRGFPRNSLWFMHRCPRGSWPLSDTELLVVTQDHRLLVLTCMKSLGPDHGSAKLEWHEIEDTTQADVNLWSLAGQRYLGLAAFPEGAPLPASMLPSIEDLRNHLALYFREARDGTSL